MSAGSPTVDNCPSTPDNKCRRDTVESGVGEHVATRGVPITPTYLQGGQANNNILEEGSSGLSRCGALGACFLLALIFHSSSSIQNVCTLVD